MLKNRIGETGRARNGLAMTIIADRGCSDLDVQFEDGVIVTHIDHGNFRRGVVKHPYVTRPIKNAKLRIGETRIAKNGLRMTLIEYRNSADVDVQFEDGVIVKHRLYSSFIQGRIGHPTIKTKIVLQSHVIAKERSIDQSFLSRSGIVWTITSYNKSSDVSAVSNTGLVREHLTTKNITDGRVWHPFPYKIGNISMDKPAYIYKDTGFFFCHCIKTNRVGIMSVDEIKACPCQTLQIEKRTKETQAIEE